MPKKIILASASPRRKELLTLAGVQFLIQVPDVDETPHLSEKPQDMVKRLAELKAKEVWKGFLKNKETVLIIAADTTVVSAKGKNLGKPENVKEAAQMISSLQGKPHQVFTGYSVFKIINGKLSKKISRVIRTRVFIQALNPKEVKAYVSKGECLDKAGAYAAQGFGMAIIEKIEGSYTNVVGLPVTEVMRDLKKLGWKP